MGAKSIPLVMQAKKPATLNVLNFELHTLWGKRVRCERESLISF